MKHHKASPIQTSMGKIVASLTDQLTNGHKINSGSMFLQIHQGFVKLEHQGKEHEIQVGASGLNLVLTAKSNNRAFVTDIEKLVNHAIDEGLLEPGLRFEEETT